MITSVTGTADEHQLVFNYRLESDMWEVSVPPDMSDGRYVVTITATKDNGLTTTWRGVLYMLDGRCVRLELVERISIRFEISDTRLELLPCINPELIERTDIQFHLLPCITLKLRRCLCV